MTMADPTEVHALELAAEAVQKAASAAADRIEDLEDQVADLEHTLAAEAREYAALEEMSRAMAGAIGWEARGDSWVEKAVNWRANPDDLPGLHMERNELRHIVQALAAIDPAGDDGELCVICLQGPAHEPECPWQAACAYAERREAEVDAGGHDA